MSHSPTEPVRILIADDHELVRDGIRSRLENSPELQIVGEAVNGLQAVQMVDELAPDLILMDINMPKLNGLDAVERIKDKNLPTRILLLSIHDDAEYLRRAMTLETNGYLLKDVTQAEMVAAIKQAAGGDFYVHSKLAPALADIKAGSDQGASSDIPYGLTNREREVLAAIAKGKLNKEIANDLRISIRTVESHRSSIREKTGGGNAAMLSKIALELGLD